MTRLTMGSVYQEPKKIPILPRGGIAGRAECVGMDVARIHPLVEEVDRFPLSCAVHAADDDKYGKTLQLSQVVLCVEQGGAQCRHLTLIFFLADFMADFRGFKHAFLLPCCSQNIATTGRPRLDLAQTFPDDIFDVDGL
jgi:hypothetical protein